MLDPEYIRHMTDSCEQIASLLHEEILKRVIERIMIRLKQGKSFVLTATDKWALETLQEAGYLMEDVKKEIAARTPLLLDEVAAAFEDACVQALTWDNAVYEAAGLAAATLGQSPYLMRIARRNYEKTCGELKNFTGTLAKSAQQKFIRACDKAYQLVASGTVSYTQAVCQAIEEASAGGVIVEYPSGHRDTIETATLRAVRTGVGQATGEITLARMKEMKWPIALVSAHLGARTGDGMDNWTNHYWWQGKFYRLEDGSWPAEPGWLAPEVDVSKFPPLSVCGIGMVDGLFGANCRHSIGPGDGVHNPFEHFDSEENRKQEKLEQRQRALERRIRASRREVMDAQAAMEAADDPTLKAELEQIHRKKAQKLARQEAEYDAFCKENDLRKLYDRLQVAGYGPNQAKAAERAAEEDYQVMSKEQNFNGSEKTPQTIANSGKSDILRSTGGTPVEITDRSVESVPRIQPQGWSDGQADSLQNAHRELLREAKGHPVGTEAGFVCDMAGKIVEKRLNEIGALSLPRVRDEHIVIHNHPDCETFSGTDLWSFVKRGSCRGMTAIGNDGKTLYAIFKQVDYDQDAVEILLTRAAADLGEAEKEKDLAKYIMAIERFLEEVQGYGVQVVKRRD